MQCSSQKCLDRQITLDSARVEVKTPLPRGKLSGNWRNNFLVSWGSTGNAVFHRTCWDFLVKAVQARSKPDVTISAAEKALIKEAAKTAEYHDSLNYLKQEAAKVAKLIKESSHCVAFTGAGISTAAGIGDYRGKEGKWTEQDQSIVDIGSLIDHGVLTPPQKCIVEDDLKGSDEEDGIPYEELRPTYTHEALYKLMQEGKVAHIISQNGDGLHGLSGVPGEHLSELHGNVFIEKCGKCQKRYKRSYYVMDDVSSQYYEELEGEGKTDIKRPRHAQKCKLCGLCHRTGRKCNNGKCHGFLEDTIINFRDNLEKEILETAEANAVQCDLMLCLGTTLQVTPACDLVDLIQKSGTLLICNRQKTDRDRKCSQKGLNGIRVYGDCDTLMRAVMKQLLLSTDMENWDRERVERMKHYDKQRDETK